MSQAYANLLGEHHYFVSVITKWKFCSNARTNLLWIVVWDIYTQLLSRNSDWYYSNRTPSRIKVHYWVSCDSWKVHYTVTYDAYLK